MVLQQPSDLTFEEFLELEGRASVRHELVGGQAFAMAGGSLRHSMCIAGLVAALLPLARAEGCRASQGDALLRTGAAAYYPDAMVSCGPMVSGQFEMAPCLVAEVLSPTTEAVDRREKRTAYTAIPSVLTYLLVDHIAEEVEVHERIGSRFAVRSLRAGDVLELRCPEGAIAIADLFVGLPPATLQDTEPLEP